jgi:hypothetical protein
VGAGRKSDRHNFARWPDPSHLEDFVGKSVTDITGRVYPLETNPNALFSLRKLTRTSFEEVYRIVV